MNTETPQQRDRATTIFERSVEGRRAFTPPPLDVPETPIDDLLPKHLQRTEPPRLPEVSEPEIVRHYTRLSSRNFHLDQGFYPLGSCTMKHNPKLHERVAALPGNARLHPAQHPARAQGALQVMWELQQALAEISGLPHVSLQPSAGSHGELAGVLVTRAYHEAQGQQLVQRPLRHVELGRDERPPPALGALEDRQLVVGGRAHAELRSPSCWLPTRRPASLIRAAPESSGWLAFTELA